MKWIFQGEPIKIIYRKRDKIKMIGDKIGRVRVIEMYNISNEYLLILLWEVFIVLFIENVEKKGKKEKERRIKIKCYNKIDQSLSIRRKYLRQVYKIVND